ncbi:lysophospholipid acyltransferase family protein [Thiococcus pfennigii]|uniref:lysophospholipid acyltransferase family protein n=1 Tax=Thiococcus pfennigii TaxID=1057 RepID=UPI001907DDAE|nr:lysophospholipid acyltransferase family protein [Thiococcus pfennigii]MBK1699711.1 hypothetical protein [Thiococcus pfennigii]
MPQRQSRSDTSRSIVPERFGPHALWRWPLGQMPHRHDRTLTRLITRLALMQIVEVAHWERLLPARDPFILVANHGSHREALYLAALCLLLRSGKPVRFLADWNFRLYPGVGYLYERSGAITVARKPAKPRFLNRFKDRFVLPTSPLDQARATLAAGGAVGLFPEGTVNRSATHLLRGRRGAARLSLELGVPLLPVGLRFARCRRDGRLDSNAALTIEVGMPLQPPTAIATPTPASLHDWHRQMMLALASLSGKVWTGEDRGCGAPRNRSIHPMSGPANPARGGSVC